MIPEAKKDEFATESYNPNGLMQTTIKAMKKVLPQIVVIPDIGLAPFKIHGHSGIADNNGVILNDPTFEVLV